VTIVHTARGIHIVHVHEPVLINDNSTDDPRCCSGNQDTDTTSTGESHLVRGAVVQQGISTAYDKSQKKAAGFNAASR
jgi:hypothetical protein